MYSIDRRKLAIHVYTLLSSLRKTAIILQVSHTTISRWLKNPERKSYNRKALKVDQIVDIIKTTITSNPFITVRKFEKVISDTLNIQVSRELVRVVIKKLGFTTKKAKFFSKPNHIKQTTEAFIHSRDQFVKENRYIVSLDETSFGRNGKPVFGYSIKGSPLILSKPPPKAKATSVLAVVDNKGIVAKKSVQGAYNTNLFLEFLQSLQLPIDTIILLDNVRFHHSNVIKEFAQTKKWKLLYVPPYSPWFNPIEEVFSIVKRHYYQYWNIDTAFDSIKESHCKSFFEHALNQKLK